MNITFNFKNFEPSDHLRDYARKRFDKLAKYTVATDASELQVNLAVEKTRQMADVIFLADNMHISAHEVSEDMYSTIDMILDKVEAQAKKFRGKQKDRRRQEVRQAMERNLQRILHDRFLADLRAKADIKVMAKL